MSPRLDASMDRREAHSALLAMLAVVMGLCALPEPVAAEETPAPDVRLNGVFLGMANCQRASTRLRIFMEDGEVWARASWLGALDEEDAPVLTSTDPAVVRFVSELIGLFPVEPVKDAVHL